MQILSIYNNQVLRGRDEEREKWINIVRTIFFSLVGHMRKILSKQLYGWYAFIWKHTKTQYSMLTICCSRHVPITKLLLVGARCCVGIGHLSAFKTQCLNWFSFYFTLHTDTTKCSFCLSLTYTCTHIGFFPTITSNLIKITSISSKNCAKLTCTNF